MHGPVLGQVGSGTGAKPLVASADYSPAWIIDNIDNNRILFEENNINLLARKQAFHTHRQYTHYYYWDVVCRI